MSILVPFNGSQYLIPVAGETGWATPVTNILVDLGNNAVSLVQSQTLTNKLIQLQAGAVGTPSLTFAADTTTGLYQPASHQIAVATNGTEQLLVDASGNISVLTGNLTVTAGNETITAGNLTMSAGSVLLAGASSAVTGSGQNLNLTTSSTNDIVLKANNTEYMRISSAGAITFSNGASMTSPTMTGSPVAPTQSTSDNTTKIATTAFVTTAVASGPGNQNVGRNLLHNAVFSVAQRGTGAFTSSGYTLDQWRLALTTDTDSVSQVALADADRTAIGDESVQFALQNVFTGNAAAGAFSYVHQRVENVTRLSGKSITISFWAKAATGTPKIGINAFQSFGTGGSPSSSAFATATSVTISTTWTRYSATIAVPSIIGKTLGSNGDHFTEIELWFSSGSTNNSNAGGIGVQSGTFQFWGMQAEIGSAASVLEKRDPQVELALCQRYYSTAVYNWAGYGAASSNQTLPTIFPVTMRGTPTVTLPTPTQSNCSGATSSSASAMGYSIFVTITATAGFQVTGTWIATAEL